MKKTAKVTALPQEKHWIRNKMLGMVNRWDGENVFVKMMKPRVGFDILSHTNDL